MGLQLRLPLLQGSLQAHLAEHRGAGQARRGADRAAIGRRVRGVYRGHGQHDLRAQLHRDLPARAGGERAADDDADAAVRTEQSRGEHGGQQCELLRAEDSAECVDCLLLKQDKCGILRSRDAHSRDSRRSTLRLERYMTNKRKERHTGVGSGGHDHHRRVLGERLHADDRLPVADREAFIRAPVLPSHHFPSSHARRDEFELLDRVADLLKAIRVQFQIIARARKHQKRRPLEQNQLVALRELRDRVELLLETLGVGNEALDHVRPRLKSGGFLECTR